MANLTFDYTIELCPVSEIITLTVHAYVDGHPAPFFDGENSFREFEVETSDEARELFHALCAQRSAWEDKVSRLEKLKTHVEMAVRSGLNLD